MENSHSQQTSSRPSDPYKRDPKNRELPTDGFDSNPWRDNHGNLLLGFTAILCLVGATIIACQQTKFTAPKFPSKLNPNGDTALEEGTIQPNPTRDDVRPVMLQIIGAASDEGTMRIAVYTSPEGFNDPTNAFEVDNWQIVDGVCAGLWEMPNELKRVAIATYHDANSNGELDRNRLGIPTERYGFSNNARGLTGPPSFEEAAIEITDQPIEISIR